MKGPEDRHNEGEHGLMSALPAAQDSRAINDDGTFATHRFVLKTWRSQTLKILSDRVHVVWIHCFRVKSGFRVAFSKIDIGFASVARRQGVVRLAVAKRFPTAVIYGCRRVVQRIGVSRL